MLWYKLYNIERDTEHAQVPETNRKVTMTARELEVNSL